MTDVVEQLLTSLPNRDRRIVALSLEGKAAREISSEISRAERTVRRTLENFRNKLEKEVVRHSSVARNEVSCESDREAEARFPHRPRFPFSAR